MNQDAPGESFGFFSLSNWYVVRLEVTSNAQIERLQLHKMELSEKMRTKRHSDCAHRARKNSVFVT